MTSPRLDYDMALPHGGLLAFIRRNAPQPRTLNEESAPPPYCTKLTLAHSQDDDESQIGFWGEVQHDAKRIHISKHLARGYNGIYALCTFWFAISICILGAFGALFVLDLACMRLGMVHGIAGRGIAGREVRRARHLLVGLD